MAFKGSVFESCNLGDRAGSLSWGGWASSFDSAEAQSTGPKHRLLVNVQDLIGATPGFRMDVNITQHPWKLPMNAVYPE